MKTNAQRIATCVNKDQITYLTEAEALLEWPKGMNHEGWYWFDERGDLFGPFLSAFEADEDCTRYTLWLERQDV